MKKSSAILSTKGVFAYSLGILGVQLVFGYVNSIHSEFVRDAYQALDGNILYVAAAIILLGKVLSCVADPIIGSIIDRSNLKGGKMRPFILFSAIPLAALTVVMFVYIPFGNLGNAGKYVMYLYIAVMTALWNISMSFADIPSQGMLARLSPVPKERTKAAAVSNTCKSIGLGIPGVMITLVSLVFPSLKTDAVKSYFSTAVVVAVLGVLLYMLIYWCNRERVTVATERPVGFKEMFVELKENKNIRIVFLGYMLGFGRNIAQSIPIQASIVLIGTSLTLPVLGEVYLKDYSWVIGLTSAVVSALGLVAIPFINKKWGERKSFILIAMASGVLGLAGFITYLCFPASSAFRGGTTALWFIWVVQALVSIMYCTHNYIPTIMTADILDYQEWKTGTRKDGVDYAILSMSHKLATGISMAAGVFLVGLSGYNGTESTVQMKNIVFLAYIGLPAVCSILSTIPMFFYKIDADTKRVMHAELAERRAATAAPEVAAADAQSDE